jgi:hypothetical protein
VAGKTNVNAKQKPRPDIEPVTIAIVIVLRSRHFSREKIEVDREIEASQSVSQEKRTKVARQASA